MSEQIKRLKRELKFKGTIIDFYQDTMEINGDHTVVWDFIKHKGVSRLAPGRAAEIVSAACTTQAINVCGSTSP